MSIKRQCSTESNLTEIGTNVPRSTGPKNGAHFLLRKISGQYRKYLCFSITEKGVYNVYAQTNTYLYMHTCDVLWCIFRV